MKILIDSSFVVALVNPKDENHEKALNLSIEFDRRPMLITDVILLEIGNALARGFKSESIDAIEGLLASNEVEVLRLDEILFERAFELYKSHADKSYGLVDCISFVVMRDHEISAALTHDRHFVQAGFRALMRDPIN